MNKNLVYLTQSDTTVGFLSSDDKKLASIKNRPTTQKTLRVVDSFKTLKSYTRIPKQYRKKVHNAKNTTFIYPNGESFRVVSKYSQHHSFIKKFEIMYSTSANETGKEFDKEFAQKNANISILTKVEYQENNSSKLVKISKSELVNIR